MVVAAVWRREACLALVFCIGVAWAYGTSGSDATAATSPRAWALLVLLGLSVGMLHGALDVLLLWPQQGWPQQVWSKAGLQRASLFLAYGAIAAVLMLAFVQWPVVGLLALLLVSAWHFGEQPGHAPSKNLGDTRWARAAAVSQHAAQGTAALAAAWYLHDGAVLQALRSIYNFSPAAEQVVVGLWTSLAALHLVAVLACLACAVAAALRLGPGLGHGLGALARTAHEVLMAWLPFLVLDPLTAFALWFALHHALRHIALVWTNAQHTPAAIALAAVVLAWALSVLACAFVVWRMPQVSDHGVSQIQAYASWSLALLAALAALTFPHAWVVRRWYRRGVGAQLAETQVA
jgi:beta-carotene 15,15'-dioxygenase